MAKLGSVGEYIGEKLAASQKLVGRGNESGRNQISLGVSMRQSFASKAMLAVLAIPGAAAFQACRADLLPDRCSFSDYKDQHPAECNGIKVTEIQDAGGLDGFGDIGRRGGVDSVGIDGGIDAAILDTDDAKDGATDIDVDAVVLDAEDAKDGSTDDVVILDTEDAKDGSTDGDADVAILDAQEIKDGATDQDVDADVLDLGNTKDVSKDVDAGVLDTGGAKDGSTDKDVDAAVLDADEVKDSSTDGDSMGLDADDVKDSSTDGDGMVLDADGVNVVDSPDGDGVIDVGPLDVGNVDDSNDGSADNISEVSEVQDSSGVDAVAEVNEPPKTCDGQPVGALKTFYTGPKVTKGEGLCADGFMSCAQDGTWKIIKEEVTPKVEVCNGFDDDCNGKTDEDQISYNGPLGTAGVGMCQAKVDKCVDGSYKTIQDEVQPSKDVCNNKDDNCDGVTDEGLAAVKQPPSFDPLKDGKGICKAAVVKCINGVTSVDPEVGPKPETCNSIDDDCDGATDNGLPTKNYFTENPAEIGVGICQQGQEVCNPKTGQYEISIAEVTAAKVGEICYDNLDNNCDGVTDEAVCTCDVDGNGLVDLEKFEPALKNAILESLNKGPNDNITLDEAAKVLALNINGKALPNLFGIECFANLKTLYANNNKLVDTFPLKNLPLVVLYLESNLISDITPLIDSPALGKGSTVSLIGNTIPDKQVKTLKAKGVTVYF